MLEDKFHDISTNTNTSQTSARGKSKKKSEKQKPSGAATKSSKTLPSINFYPENWRVRTEKVAGLECLFLTLFCSQWTGQIILTVILAILILVVISLFKMVSTLDNIDTRLHNMEKLFNLS